MAIDSGGNVSEYIVFARNCICEKHSTHFSGGNRFQRSNGVDTVLYKTYIFHAQIV